MNAATQAIVAQAIVVAAVFALAWRLYSIAFSQRTEVRCARCPEPGPSSKTPELPPGAHRPAAMRVLNATNPSGGAGRGD
jgi:hypothetical protein